MVAVTMRALLRANASMLFSLARRAVRGAALSMASIPAAQGQEPVSLDLPGERAVWMAALSIDPAAGAGASSAPIATG